jgi:predicted regulator of Ras-like GTPase activity (Roadblock/LC7/MglB family)
MLDDVVQEMARRAPGFRGAAVVGMDGVPLVRLGTPGGPDLDLCAAEYSALLRKLQSMASHAAGGGLRGVLTLLDGCTVLVERVTDDYFLLLAVAPDEPIGRGRYELHRAAAALEPELR